MKKLFLLVAGFMLFALTAQAQFHSNSKHYGFTIRNLTGPQIMWQVDGSYYSTDYRDTSSFSYSGSLDLDSGHDVYQGGGGDIYGLVEGSTYLTFGVNGIHNNGFPPIRLSREDLETLCMNSYGHSIVYYNSIFKETVYIHVQKQDNTHWNIDIVTQTTISDFYDYF